VIQKRDAWLLITGSNFELSTRAWIKFPHVMLKNWLHLPSVAMQPKNVTWLLNGPKLHIACSSSRHL